MSHRSQNLDIRQNCHSTAPFRA